MSIEEEEANFSRAFAGGDLASCFGDGYHCRA